MFILALAVAVGAFVWFMSLVGSPSQAETIIGLIISSVVFLAVFIMGWRFKSKTHEQNQNDKIARLEAELKSLKSKE